MAYDNAKKAYSKEHLWICEITVGGTTWRFCENRSPLPVGLDAIPTLRSQSTSPTQVDLTGGIGVRASASVTIADHQDYTEYGTATAPVRFWANWRARNPNYQGGTLKLLSGYISGNTYDPENFTTREYVIESFKMTEKGASFSAKDPLKLAHDAKAKAPRKSTGKLLSDIDTAATAATLSPAGVGDAEYPSSGHVRMGKEVCSFTRTGDNLTLVRGEYNTEIEEHGSDDSVQLCLYYNASLSDIIYDLLTVYANMPANYIDKVQWDNEASIHLPGLYETLITEPVGVQTLLKELGEQAPHYLYWDEKVNKIRMAAIAEPPETAQVITSEGHILEGSTAVDDAPDMRLSTIIVNFGQHDPTKKLDEFSNYRQSYIREDANSVTKYGSRKFKTINSRWINNTNKAAAVRLAARYGRRFSDIPRKISFALDAKDSDIWTGWPVHINSFLMLDETGQRHNVPFQIISAKEADKFIYTALEHTYADELPDDFGTDDPNQRLVVLSGEQTNLNLRDVYDTLYPDVQAEYDVIFVFDPQCVAGSTSAGNYSIDTGAWPELTTPPLLDVRGLLIGKGGDGGAANQAGANGGGALTLSNDIRLSNTGIIGGGGGGGGGAGRQSVSGDQASAAGGGGAGYTPGMAGTGSFATGGYVTQAEDGTHTNGGKGAEAESDEVTAFGGDAGGLGEDGAMGVSIGDGPGNNYAGGLAGKAINLNGKTITYIQTGDIRGTVS